jgi:hypothetical protein
MPINEKIIFAEIRWLKTQIGDLSKKVEENNFRSEEILQEIDHLWNSDPEVNENEL